VSLSCSSRRWYLNSGLKGYMASCNRCSRIGDLSPMTF
jgi:hypothetical protein